MVYKLINCAHCNKTIYILEQYVKDSMYCTVACLEKGDMENIQSDFRKSFTDI
jgi:hypothetical protein